MSNVIRVKSRTTTWQYILYMIESPLYQWQQIDGDLVSKNEKEREKEKKSKQHSTLNETVCLVCVITIIISVRQIKQTILGNFFQWWLLPMPIIHFTISSIRSGSVWLRIYQASIYKHTCTAHSSPSLTVSVSDALSLFILHTFRYHRWHQLQWQ